MNHRKLFRLYREECLALAIDTSLTGGRVAREPDELTWRRGRPLMIVSDNATKLTSRATLQWQEDRAVEWHHIARSRQDQTMNTVHP